jgi:hypothetical protein
MATVPVRGTSRGEFASFAICGFEKRRVTKINLYWLEPFRRFDYEEALLKHCPGASRGSFFRNTRPLAAGAAQSPP